MGLSETGRAQELFCHHIPEKKLNTNEIYPMNMIETRRKKNIMQI